MCDGEIRIEGHRLLEERNRVGVLLLVQLSELVLAAQIEVVGREVLRRRRRGAGELWRKGEFRRADNAAGDVVLDGEDVLHRTVVLVRPRW